MKRTVSGIHCVFTKAGHLRLYGAKHNPGGTACCPDAEAAFGIAERFHYSIQCFRPSRCNRAKVPTTRSKDNG
jgi:hypothetical protein